MKFSVIIPVYNKANTICESIDSILNQTFKDFEIIIVDDGSKDNLDDVLKKYGNQIKVIKQKNGGVSVARNTGIKHARGEFICFLDADDLWFNNHLLELDNLINKYKNCDYFITSHVSTDSLGKEIYSNRKLDKKFFDSDFLVDDLIGLVNKVGDGITHTNSICVKKNILKKCNLFFEPGEKIGEDTDLWYRISFSCPVVISKKITTMYRRENSTATKVTSNTFDWIFARRYDDIISNSLISDKVKESYKFLIDRYNLTCAREYLLLKDKNQAFNIINKVNHKKTLKYFLTRILCYLPLSLSNIIIKVKYNRG